jgi:hypothetical protein
MMKGREVRQDLPPSLVTGSQFRQIKVGAGVVLPHLLSIMVWQKQIIGI